MTEQYTIIADRRLLDFLIIAMINHLHKMMSDGASAPDLKEWDARIIAMEGLRPNRIDELEALLL